MKKYALGVDYGTNSVRALVVDIASGEEVATAVFNYPSGDAGILLDPSDPSGFDLYWRSIREDAAGQIQSLRLPQDDNCFL